MLNPHGATFCLRKYAPGPIFVHFLAKLLALFKKAAGRGKCIVAGHTPNSRGINIYIERASHNNIGRRGAPKIFWRKKYIFFWTSFFLVFSKICEIEIAQKYFMITTQKNLNNVLNH